MAAAQTPAKKMAGGLTALLPTIGGGLPLPTQLAAGDAYNRRRVVAAKDLAAVALASPSMATTASQETLTRLGNQC